MSANVAHVERAPRDYELYANGPHAASGTYEIGSVDLSKERSNNFEAGTKWQRGANRFSLNVYYNRYSSYIALMASGAQRNRRAAAPMPGPDRLPVFVFTPGAGALLRVRSGRQRAAAGGMKAADALDLELRADSVRATNLQTNEPLPRISPWRAGSTLVWRGRRLRCALRLRLFRAAGPGARRATCRPPAIRLFNASLDWRMKAGPTNLLWYARIDNIGNRLAVLGHVRS